MTANLVTVCVISYNHARFAERALKSVVAQKVSFPYEIIIADDCSTDGTREVAEAVANQSPVPVRFLPRHRRLGARDNFFDLLAAAQSRYVAYLEADDCWVNINRLQEQVTLLESRSDLSGCFGRAEVVDGDGQALGDYFAHHHTPQPPVEADQRSVVARGASAPSCTMVFRREAIVPLPVWYRADGSHQGLGVVLTEHGRLAFVDQVWGLYTVHDGGTWSSGTVEHRVRSDLAYAVALARDPSLARQYPHEIGRRLAVAGVLAGKDWMMRDRRLPSLAALGKQLRPGLIPLATWAATRAVPDLARVVKRRLDRNDSLSRTKVDPTSHE